MKAWLKKVLEWPAWMPFSQISALRPPIATRAPNQLRRVTLAKKHTGMRVDAHGLIRNAGAVMKGKNADYYRGCTEILIKQLREAADRYYEGDPSAPDEFFQLYRLDDKRPENS